VSKAGSSHDCRENGQKVCGKESSEISRNFSGDKEDENDREENEDDGVVHVCLHERDGAIKKVHAPIENCDGVRVPGVFCSCSNGCGKVVVPGLSIFKCFIRVARLNNVACKAQVMVGVDVRHVGEFLAVFFVAVVVADFVCDAFALVLDLGGVLFFNFSNEITEDFLFICVREIGIISCDLGCCLVAQVVVYRRVCGSVCKGEVFGLHAHPNATPRIRAS